MDMTYSDIQNLVLKMWGTKAQALDRIKHVTDPSLNTKESFTLIP